MSSDTNKRELIWVGLICLLAWLLLGGRSQGSAIVTTECMPGFILADGKLSAADHESNDGYFNVIVPSLTAEGSKQIPIVSLSVLPASSARTIMATHVGERGLLIWRPMPVREIQKEAR